MTLKYEDEPRRIIEDRLIREVIRFYKQIGKPMPYRTLSQKYTSALGGRFAETMDDLCERGIVRVQYTPTGARMVYPATVAVI